MEVISATGDMAAFGGRPVPDRAHGAAPALGRIEGGSGSESSRRQTHRYGTTGRVYYQSETGQHRRNHRQTQTG